MIGFIAGLEVGGIIGIVFMCMFIMAKDRNEDGRR